MGHHTDTAHSMLDRAGRLARRGLYVAAVALGLMLGLVAGLLGWAIGGDPTIVLACLLAGAAVGWLSARATIASRYRLMLAVGPWLLGRLLPGSRAVTMLAAARAVGRAGVPRR